MGEQSRNNQAHEATSWKYVYIISDSGPEVFSYLAVGAYEVCGVNIHGFVVGKPRYRKLYTF